MRFYTSISRYGSSLLYRGYDDGKRIKTKIKFKPTLFVKGKGGSEYTALDGTNVDAIQLDSMGEAKEFVEKYKEVENFKIYGNTNYIAQYIAQAHPNDIKFDKSIVRIHYLDIEVASDAGFPEPEYANHPVISIAVKDSVYNRYYVWGLGDYDSSKALLKNEKIIYVKCKDEASLLLAFVGFWKDDFTCPDIVTGWNIRAFDIPYLVNRIAKVLGDDFAKSLSPWGMVEERQVSMRKKMVQMYEINGIAQLDYMDLFMKFGYSFGPQESYRLDHIAYVVLGERKLAFDGNLHSLYKEDHQKFIDYNIKDCHLIERMEEKIALISLCMTMAYKAGVNYGDTMGTVGIWDALIHRTLWKDKIIVPPNKHSIKDAFEGGYVKDPKCGVHDWVVSFDVNSLYPNIIVQWNMSPETIARGKIIQGVSVEQLLSGRKVKAPEDMSMAATGQCFNNSRQGFMPKIIEEMYAERVIVKGKMLDAKNKLEQCDKSNKTQVFAIESEIAQYENQQMAIKILLNSLFGACGNAHFRYFAMEIAEGITKTGQYIIQYAEQKVNAFLNKALKNDKDYVIAIDTDSVYVSLDDLVKSVYPNGADKITIVNFLDKVCRSMEKDVLDKAFADLKENCNAYKQRITMKRESIADRGIWTAKKRYILNVWDNEGVRYKEPKLKIMGIEAIKSSTPAVCRDAFQKLFKILINGTEEETQKFIADFRNSFAALPAEEKAMPRSVSSIKQYSDKNTLYKKGTPINSRAAILHNYMLKQTGTENKYETIKEGEKIKYIYLNPRNPLREDIIGFINVLPPEFGLHKFIDNDLQFEKTFLDPAKLILDAIGWQTEEISTLEGFFS